MAKRRARENPQSATFGQYPNTVVLYERVRGGTLYVRWNIPATATTPKGKAYRNLEHCDWIMGQETAREIARGLAEALTSATPLAPRRTTIADVLTHYYDDVTAHLTGKQPREGKRRVVLWTTVLGAARDPATLDKTIFDAFQRDRRAGRIELPAPYDRVQKTKQANGTWTAPSNRTLGADLEYLHAAFNHACEKNWPGTTRRMLDANPLRGYVLPKNKNPKRRVASYEHYLAVRAKAPEVHPLFLPFMDVIEAFGWRVTGICELWASDIDRTETVNAPHGRLRKRGEVDKEGHEDAVPFTAEARAAADLLQKLTGAIGDRPLFPAERAKVGAQPRHWSSKPDPNAMPKSWTKDYARTLLLRAETLAEVEHKGFHSYRRKWATERKGHPTLDVMRAAGWKSSRMVELYQSADDETTLAVMLEPKKLREVQGVRVEK